MRKSLSVHCVNPATSQIIAVRERQDGNPDVEINSQASGGSSLGTTETLISAAIKDLLKQAPNSSEYAIKDESKNDSSNSTERHKKVD